MAIFDAQWWAKRAVSTEPGAVDARARRIFLGLVAPLVRWFHRPTFDGLDHLPHDRPFLLVANHSGGMAFSEILCLLVLYLERLGHRRIAGFTHPLSFNLWPLSVAVRWIGAIPSTYEAAYAALEERAAILVFPGGDHEVSRPIWKAREVDFNGRKGFLRIARQAGVPIVPMGIAGSHYSAPILYRSEWLLPRLLILPRLFGVKRFPLMLVAVLGAAGLLYFVPPAWGWWPAIVLAWLWFASPLTMMPVVPVKVRFTIGPPLEPADLFGTGDDLTQAYDIVVDAVQALVDRA